VNKDLQYIASPAWLVR